MFLYISYKLIKKFAELQWETRFKIQVCIEKQNTYCAHSASWSKTTEKEVQTPKK